MAEKRNIAMKTAHQASAEAKTDEETKEELGGSFPAAGTSGSTAKTPAGRPEPSRPAVATRGTTSSSATTKKASAVPQSLAQQGTPKVPAGRSSLVDMETPELQQTSMPGATRVGGPGHVPSTNEFDIDGSSRDEDDHHHHQDTEDQQQPTHNLPIAAQVVDEDPSPRVPSAHASPMEEGEHWGRRRIIMIGGVLVAVIATAVVTAMVVTRDDSPATITTAFPTKTPTLQPSSSPSLSQRPSQAPSIPRGPRKPFETTQELYDAVDAYLADSSVHSQVIQTYGWPIGEWDVSRLTDFYGVFNAGNSFIEPRNPAAVDFNEYIGTWSMSRATRTRQMFAGCRRFNQSIDEWDVSSVVDMAGMFLDANDFNQPLNSWNVSSVLDIQGLFVQATSFNQALDQWDVSNVWDLSGVFQFAFAFNQPLSTWDTSNATDMLGMFAQTLIFNQDISSWNTSRVQSMRNMFNQAIFFNQPIGNWDVSSVTNLNGFLGGALSFNQPLGDWDVSAVTDMRSFALQARAFNQDLCTWGGRLANTTAIDDDMFQFTSCNVTTSPSLLGDVPGPFCYPCS